MTTGVDTTGDQLPPPHSRGCIRFSDAWARDERDYDTWFAADFDEEDADDWRRAGFSASEAAAWVAADATYEASSTSDYVRLASAWTVAGFAPGQASDWDDVLAHHDVAERPMLARQWKSAGFSAETAKPWTDREDVTTAVALANNGWEPWQRDMMDVLLGHPQADSAERVGLIASGLAPGNVLDYLRAGVDPREYGWYERLRRQEQDVEPLLAAEEARHERSYDTDSRLDWILSSVVQTGTALHLKRPRIFVKPDPYGFIHTSPYAELASWSGPKLVETWRENGGVEVWTHEGGEWMSGGCPEDFAYEPRFDWTDEDEARVRAAMAAHFGDETASVVVSWPPEGSLWTEGQVWSGDAEGCGVHEEFQAACADCRPAPPSEVSMAEWRWYVDVRLITVEDGQERDEYVDHAHVLTSSVDPRCIEYSHVALR
jgi:hypothetical protein